MHTSIARTFKSHLLRNLKKKKRFLSFDVKNKYENNFIFLFINYYILFNEKFF